MNFLTRIIISTISVLVVAYILPGVEVSTPYVGFIVAVVLTLLNTIVKPVLIILTLPITM